MTAKPMIASRLKGTCATLFIAIPDRVFNRASLQPLKETNNRVRYAVSHRVLPEESPGGSPGKDNPSVLQRSGDVFTNPMAEDPKLDSIGNPGVLLNRRTR
jgi:hypothetical protein